MNPSAPFTRYRPDIDGLRAIAVAAVVAFHAFPKAVRGGFVGVDVFFVVSGFLITSIILADIDRGQFSLLNFYTRRVRRLFPALLVVLASVLAFGWWVLLADEYRTLGRDVAASTAFISNFVFWSEAGYFDIASEYKPLLHLWSLAVEEQFYVLWPPLLLIAVRMKSLPYVVAAVVLVSFILNAVLIRTAPTATFFLPHTRMWELALGGLLAYFVGFNVRSQAFLKRYFFARDRVAGLLPDLASILGLALVIASAIVLKPGRNFPGISALLPTVGTALIILAGQYAWIGRKLLSHPALVYLGLISYPLYLWHWPLISFAHILHAGFPPRPLLVGCILVSIVLAALTYECIEKPIRFGRSVLRVRAAGEWRVRLLSVGAVIGCCGLLIARYDGVPSRPVAMAAPVLEPYVSMTEPNLHDNELARRIFNNTFSGQPIYFNVTAASAASLSVTAVIGDSHANVLFGALRRAGMPEDRLINLGKGACLALFDLDTVEPLPGKSIVCQPTVNNILEFVIRSPQISEVVIGGFYNFYLNGRVWLRSTSRAEATPRELLQGAFRSTIGRLIAANKAVVVVYDVPELPLDPRRCLSYALRPIKLPIDLDCSLPLDRHLMSMRAQQGMLAGLQQEFPQVKFFDPTDRLCDRKSCAPVVEGNLIFSDRDHLSGFGAALLGVSLRQALMNR